MKRKARTSKLVEETKVKGKIGMQKSTRQARPPLFSHGDWENTHSRTAGKVR
jgi:hypothetical protein